MRITLRRAMTILAVVAISLGLYVHICRLIEDQDDFAMPILFTEAVILAFLGAVVWGTYWLVKLLKNCKNSIYNGTTIPRREKVNSAVHFKCAVSEAWRRLHRIDCRSGLLRYVRPPSARISRIF